jgi:hypothetical protein
MVLVHEYIEMRRRQKPTVFVGFGSQDSGGEDKFKEREKRDFMTSILKLIQVNFTYNRSFWWLPVIFFIDPIIRDHSRPAKYKKAS